MSQTARLSAHYKDMDNNMHTISGLVGIEPEGVTENDVELFRKETYHFLANSGKSLKEPLLVVIKGGKVDAKEAA
jgi:hypothetical protein